MLFIISLTILLLYYFTKRKIFYWLFILCLALYGFMLGVLIGISPIINSLF